MLGGGKMKDRYVRRREDNKYYVGMLGDGRIKNIGNVGRRED